MGKARLQFETKPVQDREFGLVNAVHVTGDCAWSDVRGVVVTDVEHIMTFVKRLSVAWRSFLAFCSTRELELESVRPITLGHGWISIREAGRRALDNPNPIVGAPFRLPPFPFLG
jgi:hypothetical protein